MTTANRYTVFARPLAHGVLCKIVTSVFFLVCGGQDSYSLYSPDSVRENVNIDTAATAPTTPADMFGVSSDDDDDVACGNTVAPERREMRSVKKRKLERERDTYSDDDCGDDDARQPDIVIERRTQRKSRRSKNSSSSSSSEKRRRGGEFKKRRVVDGGRGGESTRTDVELPPTPTRRSGKVDPSAERANEGEEEKTVVRSRRVDRSATTIRPTVACDTANEMVRRACLNIHNTDSIDVMEWSEAVLLCLASPRMCGVLEGISWADVQSECAVYEWTVKIASAIKMHLSRGDTLVTLYRRNRLVKASKSYLKCQASMFCTTPRVDTTLLSQFRPPVHVHTRMKLNTLRFKI